MSTITPETDRSFGAYGSQFLKSDEKKLNQKIRDFLNSTFIRSDEIFPYSEAVLREYLALGPTTYFIPHELGGLFTCAESYLTLVEETSYHSVPLGLTLGIAGSLFIQPVARFASQSIRDRLIPLFLSKPQLGGMMITEPTGGTDIFNLTTSYTKTPSGLVLEGIKCWAGLTGLAHHWLVAARERKGNRLTKRINLIYVPQANPGVEVTKYYDALGLNPIPYGETHFRTTVPYDHLLENKDFGNIRIMYDTLFRSRMGIAAIAAGLCKRLAAETEERVRNRTVFGQALMHYDQVQSRLSTVRGRYHICHSLWRFTAKWMNSHQDVSYDSTLVNASKTISSEAMHVASDCAIQLFAASGFKKTHLIGQSFVNSRPFQIFEGSNDVLYENIFDVFIKQYERVACNSLTIELQKYDLSLVKAFPVDWLANAQNIVKPSQRVKVHIGKLLAWAFIMGILFSDLEGEESTLADGWRVALLEVHSLVAMFPFLH